MSEIINPKYSFVKFSVLPNNTLASIPIARNDDLYFQVYYKDIFRVEDITELDSQDIDVDLVSANGNELLVSNAGVLKTDILDSYTLLLYNEAPINMVNGEYDCFRLRLLVEGVFYYSNLIVKVRDNNFYSTISYRNREDSNDFVFEDFDRVLKVRLPFYLRQPQIHDEESVYVKSNGERVLLSSISSEIYKGIVDFMSYENHKKLKIALSSDFVEIESKYYSGKVVKDGDYDIQWSDNDDDTAQASFNVFTTPFNVKNLNCK